MNGRISPDLIRRITENNCYPLSYLDKDYIFLNVDRLYKEITKNKIPTYEESLKRDIATGLILELGVANIISGSYNDSDFDVSDWRTYAYDLIGPNGELIEVKRNNFNNKCLNINFKNEDYDGKYSFYDTFSKNCHRLDYLIVADIVENTVKIQYLINAKNFNNYLQKSNKVQGGSSHFFKNFPAENNGDLIEFK